MAFVAKPCRHCCSQSKSVQNFYLRSTLFYGAKVYTISIQATP